MQFAVLIEFLVPGLATLLLGLTLIPCGWTPGSVSDVGDADALQTLFLISIAYPIGILVNFLFYQPQRYWLTPLARRRVIAKHRTTGILNWEARGVKDPADLRREKLEDIFGVLEASIFGQNISRFDSQHQFYESLQRLARGMILPLVLAAVWLNSTQPPAFEWALFLLFVLVVLSVSLLWHSVRAGAELTVRFHKATAVDRVGPRPRRGAANPAAEPGGYAAG